MTRWDEPCGATTRTGRPCQAKAIPGGFVCRVHGGSAPQVRIAAGLRLREKAELDALLKWDETRSFNDLCKVAAAQRAVERYRAKLRLLAELRAKVRQQRPGGSTA
jgi:hypothetical protein